MMNRRPPALLSLAAIVAAGVMLSGCASPADTGAAPSASPSATATPAPSPSPTPEEQVVVLSLDGATIDGGSLVSFDDVDGVVSSFTDVFGTAPDESPVDGPYGSVWTAYDWATVRALVIDTRATVSVSADSPGV